MSVTAIISLSTEQEEFARKLVEQGHFPDLSAVVERALELVHEEFLREDTKMREEDIPALKALLERRMNGPFLTEEESQAQIDAMIAAKKAQYGL